MMNEKPPWRLRGMTKLALAGTMILALISPRSAEAASARVRWLPPTSEIETVTGYRIYVRNAGSAYGTGTPIWSGNPAPAGDGSLSTNVTYTPAPSGTNYFAVVAMRSAEESNLSQERFIGTSNPCQRDTCTTKTSCNFGVLANGTPCDDESFCNGPESCWGGVCDTNAARDCSDAFACTIDACDETADRCVHTAPAGCCVACDLTDPCLAEACDAGDCTAPGGVPMQFSRIKLLGTSESVKLVGRGRFVLSEALDPSATGVEIEMRAADGALVYSSVIAPYLFRTGAAAGRYRYVASRAGAEIQSNGIERLDFRMKGDQGLVTIMGHSANFLEAAAEGSLTVSMKFGSTQCVRDVDIPCVQKKSLSLCRHS